MADLLTGTDAEIAIGPVAADTVTDAAGFAALTPYTVIGFVEKIGEYGDESNEVKGNVISEGRTRRAKGTRDAGMQVITCFVKADDAGQMALKAAQLTSNRYAIRIKPRDRPEPTGTDSISYYRGLVMSAKKGELSSDGLQRIVFNIGIDSEIVEVDAAMAPT